MVAGVMSESEAAMSSHRRIEPVARVLVRKWMLWQAA
jgi:hypothetical protein